LRYREIARQILYDVPINVMKRPLDSYEYDKYIHLIDIPLKETVIGHINGKRNILVFNFWLVFFGLLTDSNISDALDISGSTKTVGTAGDFNLAAAYLTYGYSTSPELFYQNSLVSYGGSISTSRSFGQLSDRNRITLSGVSPAEIQEIGIYQSVNPASSWTIMYARKQMYVPRNKTINYYIDFLMPWTYNCALLMYGFLSEANVSGAIDAYGASYTLRSSGDVNAGAVRMRVSQTLYSWSPSLTNISYDLELSTYRTVGNARSAVYLFIVGIASPTTDISVNTISLIQSLYDTGGTGHDTYVLILPLQTPITLYAGRTNVIFLRFVAM